MTGGKIQGMCRQRSWPELLPPLPTKFWISVEAAEAIAVVNVCVCRCASTVFGQ